MKKILKSEGMQSLIASLICILIGLLIGFIALLIINPENAWEGICDVVKNFMSSNSSKLRMKNLGNTLTNTAPLIMCSLSVLFSYKVGLFNIGAAGQYVAGSLAALYAALAWHWHWLPCLLIALVAGAALGAISGALKALFNVNEVISGIMLNWIGLYTTNIILTTVKSESAPETLKLAAVSKNSILPSLGMEELFGGNKYVGIAIPLSILFAVLIWILLNKTKFGFECKATGLNKDAARYCGMAEKRNIVLSLAISGMLAGLGGAFLYLTDIQQWQVSATSVPNMGFNGIAAAFLGGLDPIGAIFSSFFIQHISDGGGKLNTTYYCSQVSDLIAACIIYLCGFVGFIKMAMKARSARTEEKKAAKVASKGGSES